MNKQEIFEFLNQNASAALATTDGNISHVRYIWTYKSDEKGIVFHTSKMKEMFKQLINNPNAEFCFTNAEKNVQIRVAGKAKLINDIQLKKEIVSKRSFLKEIEKKHGNLDFLNVFLLEECVAQIWTMATNLEPKKIVRLN